MGQSLVIAFFFAATDRLYWLRELIFHLKVIDPDGPPVARVGMGQVWIQAVISGIGGVAGAYAITQLTHANDLVTVLAGAFIGGRLVSAAIASFTTS